MPGFSCFLGMQRDPIIGIYSVPLRYRISVCVDVVGGHKSPIKKISWWEAGARRIMKKEQSVHYTAFFGVFYEA